MTHNARCASAKNPTCRCSCRGRLHRIRRSSNQGSLGSVSSPTPNRYESKKSQEIQGTIEDYIQEKGIGHLRRMATFIDPSLSTLVRIVELIYNNRDELKEAYNQIDDTWSSNQTLEEKVTETAVTVVKTGAKIAKKEAINYIKNKVVSEVSSAAIAGLEKEGVFNKVDSSLKIPNAGEHFKGLLQDTLEKELSIIIEKEGKNND